MIPGWWILIGVIVLIIALQIWDSDEVWGTVVSSIVNGMLYLTVFIIPVILLLHLFK